MNFKVLVFLVLLVVLSLGCLCCCGSPAGGGYSGDDFGDYNYETGVDGVKAAQTQEKPTI